MKVLHVITGLEDGGAEAVLYRLCSHDAGAEHHVVSLMGPGKYGAKLEEAGVVTDYLLMRRGMPSLRGLMRLVRIIRDAQPSVVQTWMYHANLLGGIAALLARRNLVWGIHHSELTGATTSMKTLLIARILGALSKVLPRRVVYVAQTARLSHEKAGYDRRRGVVIPNGYDLSLFRPSAEEGISVRRELRIHRTEPLIGMVARWHPDKDHRNLFEALHLLCAEGLTVRCVLVGPGMESSNDQLREALEATGVVKSCILLSHREDVPEIMNAIDAHVLSSATEAFPNVVAESMACGTPCISTDVGDVREIIGETGWVVPRRDPESLAYAIKDALRSLGTLDFSVRQESARARVVENYSLSTMVEAYHAIWRLERSDA